MLQTGEQELPAAIQSVEQQQGIENTLVVIGPLPKWEAHRRLFQRFSDDAGNHDLLVKLDADMEILEPRLLSAAALLMRTNRRLDHLVLGVDDWLSTDRIMGLSIWRSGVKWEPPPDLFTDLAQSDARDRLKLMDCGRPLVAHARNPSEAQAVRYGAHRAAKAALSRKRTRLQRLGRFAEVVAHSPAQQRRLALAAVEATLVDQHLGRRLVDGDSPVPDAVMAKLRSRAEELESLVKSVHTLIDAVKRAGDEVHETRLTGQEPRTSSPESRARAALARISLRRPIDRERALAQLLSHLDS